EITAFKLTVELEGDVGSVSEPITEEKSATVLATLKDTDNNPISGKNIDFETDLGVIEPGTMVTDSNGEARVSLRIGNEGGAGTVVATLSGTTLSDSNNFLMTQTEGGLQLSELELLDSNDNSGNGLIGKELSATNMAIARVRLVTDSG